MLLILKVEAGACTVDPNQLPNWFGETGCGTTNEELEQPWRIKILEELKARLPAQDAYTHYEQAVDTTSWVHTGEARVSLGSSAFVDCILQLEWVQTTGALTILNPDGATTMVSINSLITK